MLPTHSVLAFTEFGKAEDAARQIPAVRQAKAPDVFWRLFAFPQITFDHVVIKRHIETMGNSKRFSLYFTRIEYYTGVPLSPAL